MDGFSFLGLTRYYLKSSNGLHNLEDSAFSRIFDNFDCEIQIINIYAIEWSRTDKKINFI